MKKILRTIAIVSLLTSAFICQRVSADGIWDANKPFPVPTNDNSCWMASAANMMAADGWGDAQGIYNILRLNPDWQTHGGNPDPGFIGNYQPTAINWYNNVFNMDLDEIILEFSTGRIGRGGALFDAKFQIDTLLDTPTATETPGDYYPEGPDDPVGFAIWGDIGTTNEWAHALTAWQDLGAYLMVTDSDDGLTTTVDLPWVNDNQLIYNGNLVTVEYLSFMADVPEPSTLTIVGLGLVGLLFKVYRRRSK